MQFKYQIGDTVRITDTSPVGGVTDRCAWIMDPFLGRECKIVDAWEPPGIYMQPRYKVDCCAWTFVESWLFPVEEDIQIPDLEVGDLI